MNKYIEIDSDLLLLAAEDSERSRREAAERIRKLSPEERRDLRAALACPEIETPVLRQSHAEAAALNGASGK